MPSGDHARHLPLRYDIVSTLACSRLAKDGVARALEIILQKQSWDLGIAWLAEDQHLRYVADCVSPHPQMAEAPVETFLESVRTRLRTDDRAADAFSRKNVCSCRVSACPSACVWSKGAFEAGLQTALAVPLSCGGVVYGVIEFFSRSVRRLDADLHESLLAVADDLGKFLRSRRFETRAQLRKERMAGARRVARLAYWECTPLTGVLRSTGNMSDVLGLGHADLPATVDEYLLLLPEEEHSGFQAAMADLQNPAIGSIEFEHRIAACAGRGERVVVIQAVADFDPFGNVVSMSGTLQDITSYRWLKDRLRLAATAIDHAGDAIVIFDARGAIMSTNSAFSRITGYTDSEVRGKQLDALLNRPSGRHDESFYRRLLGRLRTFGRWKGELWARTKDGRGFAMLLSLSEIRDDKGRVSHHVGVFTDVSRQKEYKERLEQLALHDSLTGLPNRALFLDRGTQALALAQRNGAELGLVFVDLDLFKEINDNYGHAVGDEVLRQAGARMRGAMRDCDTVARLGGDEFVVLLTEVNGESACLTAAQRLVEALTHPYLVNGIHIEVGASLGVALSPVHGSDIHTLLHRADQALYSIKRDDLRRHALWRPDMQHEAAALMSSDTAYIRHFS